MLNSTVELIALWASFSPSLLAFCFSQLIIAVLLLGGRGCARSDVSDRGGWTPGAAEAETLDGVQVQGGKRSGGGDESPTPAVSTVEPRHSCAPHDVDGRVAEADTNAVQMEASEKSSGAEEEPAVAARTVQEKKCGGDEDEDELMTRAEDFIERMNRVWRAENVRLC